MRQVCAVLLLGVVVLAPVLIGCNHTPIIGPNRPVVPPASAVPPPDAASLVAYLNANAKLVDAVQANRVEIDCKQGNQPIGLGGSLACQKPRNFRLQAKVLAAPTVDIGSNSEEFWYWISKANPPYVFHCSYSDLKTGRVNTPFPFQPDMVVAALGMAEYDEKAKYEVNTPEKTNYIELIQQTTSPQGQPVQRITVFNRNKQDAPRPQVIAHALKDLKGKLICQATIQRVTVDRDTRAILPTLVIIEWPEQKLLMRLDMPDVKAVVLPADRVAALFQRTALSGFTALNLANGETVGPDGVRRAADWNRGSGSIRR